MNRKRRLMRSILAGSLLYFGSFYSVQTPAAEAEQYGKVITNTDGAVVKTPIEVTDDDHPFGLIVSDSRNIIFDGKSIKATAIGNGTQMWATGMSVTRADLTLTEATTIDVTLNSGDKTYLKGFGVTNGQGTLTSASGILDLGDKFNLKLTAQGGAYNDLWGIYQYGYEESRIGDNSIISVSSGNSKLVSGIFDEDSGGIYNISTTKIGNNVRVEAEIKDGNGRDPAWVSGIHNQAGTNYNIGNNLSIATAVTTERAGQNVRSDALQNSTYDTSATRQAGTIKIGDGLNITSKAKSTDGNAMAIGIGNYYQGDITIGANANIKTIVETDATNEYGTSSYGIVNKYESRIAIGDNATIASYITNTAKSYGIAVYNATENSKVDFLGGVNLYGTDISLYNISGIINVLGENKNKTIAGTVRTTKGGETNIKLDTAKSYMYANSSQDDTGKNNIDLSNNSTWFALGNSNVNNLAVNSGAKVDMSGDNKYTQLNVANYSGQGGNIILNTDLVGEREADTVQIKQAAAGKTYIQVRDASLLNDVMVIGNKKLLLVEDASKTALFEGKHLSTGGLWDVLPTIENGLDVGGTAEQWYLTKLAKTINQDTEVLLGWSENSYGLWRNTHDIMRDRLGYLHQKKSKADGNIWARTAAGKFNGQHSDGNYHFYQIGYDNSSNDKSAYGVAIDYGTSNSSYNRGSGKDSFTAMSVYATWYADNGSYTDLVGRVGRFNSEIDTFADYPDHADSKRTAYSLSVEYGKKFQLKNRMFIEPQAQFIIGRLGSDQYTTARGTKVYSSGINSAIGRIGVSIGQINPTSSIYFKASIMHEFAGKNTVNMQAANGEYLTNKYNFKDTWFEMGFGGELKLNKNSKIFGDAEFGLGGDIRKKWQLSAGIRWAF